MTSCKGWGSVLRFVVNSLNQHYVSPIPWIQKFRNQGINMKVNPLSINPNDPIVKVLLPISAVLASAGVEIFITKGEMLSPGDTVKIALNWNLKLPSGLFGHWINRQSTGWGDWPDYQGETGLLLHGGGKKGYCRRPFGVPLSTPISSD